MIETIIISGIRLDADTSKRVFISTDKRFVVPMNEYGLPTSSDLIQISIPRDYAEVMS
jgi:hypothetical protein